MLIVAAWSLIMQDLDSKLTELLLNGANEDDQISIGMDIKSFSITKNVSKPPMLLIKRLEDKNVRMLQTYITKESELNTRVKLLVVPIIATTQSMLATCARAINEKPMAATKTFMQ